MESLFSVQYLHQAGADLNIRDNFGKIALDLAVEYGHSGVVRYLTQADGD